MITKTVVVKGVERDKVQIGCLSTDTKPVGVSERIGNMSELIEIDTGKYFLYNQDGEAGTPWVEQG